MFSCRMYTVGKSQYTPPFNYLVLDGVAELHGLDTMLKLVSRAMNRILIGAPMCEYLRQKIASTLDNIIHRSWWSIQEHSALFYNQHLFCRQCHQPVPLVPSTVCRMPLFCSVWHCPLSRIVGKAARHFFKKTLKDGLECIGKFVADQQAMRAEHGVCDAEVIHFKQSHV